MNYRTVRKVTSKVQVLTTEIDLGLALVRICCIEWSFGDAARAARALSEARNIHLAAAAIIDSAKGGRNLTRKFAKLANLLSKVSQIVPDPSQDIAAAGGLELDSGRLRRPGIEPRAMATAAS